MGVAVDHARREPPLDEVPDAVVLVVEAARDPEVEPFHAGGQPPELGLDDHVKVVRHHAVGVVRPPEPEASGHDRPVDVRVVGVVARDRHPVHAARRDVVDRGRRQEVAWGRHSASVRCRRRRRKALRPLFTMLAHFRSVHVWMRPASRGSRVGELRPRDSPSGIAAGDMSQTQSIGHGRGQHVPETVSWTRLP